MSVPELLKHDSLKHDRTGDFPSAPQARHQILRHVLACVDASPFSDAVLAHAAAVARAADARMTVMRVLEAAAVQAPMDPVEWTLRHRDVEADLRERASRFGDRRADTVIVDGPPAERICAWARDNPVDLTVLGRGGESSSAFIGLGGTARRVAEVVTGSVLLVPSTQVTDAPIRYRRVLIPLDGSSRSECALPLGLGIAAAHDAETVLVHAAPDIDLTEASPPEAETITLRDRLRRRNERAGEQYLKQVRCRLPPMPATRARVLPSCDPRHALARAASEEHADLMVLSCTGQSGHPDMSVGSVADYLINHMHIPILLVRGHERTQPTVYGRSGRAMAARLPSRALM
jgi:nucleotide-binding universal stress UspA family protein